MFCDGPMNCIGWRIGAFSLLLIFKVESKRRWMDSDTQIQSHSGNAHSAAGVSQYDRGRAAEERTGFQPIADEQMGLLPLGDTLAWGWALTSSFIFSSGLLQRNDVRSYLFSDLKLRVTT
jgi:hypothetical protein